MEMLGERSSINLPCWNRSRLFIFTFFLSVYCSVLFQQMTVIISSTPIGNSSIAGYIWTAPVECSGATDLASFDCLSETKIYSWPIHRNILRRWWQHNNFASISWIYQRLWWLCSFVLLNMALFIFDCLAEINFTACLDYINRRIEKIWIHSSILSGQMFIQ